MTGLIVKICGKVTYFRGDVPAVNQDSKEA
jgi:hypothetical protein